MRILVFALAFTLLLASASFAEGLEITDIRVDVQYGEAYIYALEYKSVVNSAQIPVVNNSKINVDAFPGSNVTFTIRIENSFNDVDLNNIVVKVKLKKLDDGSDIDEHSADFNLKPGNDALADIKLKVPFYAESGTYDALMEVRGEDNNNTLYEKDMILKLQIKRLSHDIRIVNEAVSPDVVSCRRDVKFNAEVINLGRISEDDMTLEFQSTALGINAYDTNISLIFSKDISAEDRKYTKELEYEVPAFIKSGIYPIYLNLYLEGFILFDKKTLYLEVKDCAPSKKKLPAKEISQNESGPVVLIMPSEQIGGQNPKDEIDTISSEASIFMSPNRLLIVSFLVLGGFLIVFLVLVIFGHLRSYKQNKY